MPRFVRLPGECSRRALSVLAVVGLVVCLCGCCGGLATAERPPTVVRTRLPGRTIAVGLHLCGACLLDDRTFSAPRSKETLVALLPADLVVGVRTVRAVVLDTASGRQADVTATVRRNSTIGVFGTTTKINYASVLPPGLVPVAVQTPPLLGAPATTTTTTTLSSPLLLIITTTADEGPGDTTEDAAVMPALGRRMLLGSHDGNRSSDGPDAVTLPPDETGIELPLILLVSLAGAGLLCMGMYTFCAGRFKACRRCLAPPESSSTVGVAPFDPETGEPMPPCTPSWASSGADDESGSENPISPEEAARRRRNRQEQQQQQQQRRPAGGRDEDMLINAVHLRGTSPRADHDADPYGYGAPPPAYTAVARGDEQDEEDESLAELPKPRGGPCAASGSTNPASPALTKDAINQAFHHGQWSGSSASGYDEAGFDVLSQNATAGTRTIVGDAGGPGGANVSDFFDGSLGGGSRAGGGIGGLATLGLPDDGHRSEDSSAIRYPSSVSRMSATRSRTPSPPPAPLLSLTNATTSSRSSTTQRPAGTRGKR